MKSPLLGALFFFGMFSITGMENDDIKVQSVLKERSIIEQMLGPAARSLTTAQQSVIKTYLSTSRKPVQISLYDQELFNQVLAVIRLLSKGHDSGERATRTNNLISFICDLLELKMVKDAVSAQKTIHSLAVFFCSLLHKAELTEDEEKIYTQWLNTRKFAWPESFRSLDALKCTLSLFDEVIFRSQQRSEIINRLYFNFLLFDEHFKKKAGSGKNVKTNFRKSLKAIASHEFWQTYRRHLSEEQIERIAAIKKYTVPLITSELLREVYRGWLVKVSPEKRTDLVKLFLKLQDHLAFTSEQWLLLANVLFDEGQLGAYKNYNYGRPLIDLALLCATKNNDSVKMESLIALPQDVLDDEDAKNSCTIAIDLFKWSLAKKDGTLIFKLFTYIPLNTDYSVDDLAALFEKYKPEISKKIQGKCEEYLNEKRKTGHSRKK